MRCMHKISEVSNVGPREGPDWRMSDFYLFSRSLIVFIQLKNFPKSSSPDIPPS